MFGRHKKSRCQFPQCRDESIYQFVAERNRMQLENMRRSQGVNGVGYSVGCSVCDGFYIELGGVKIILFQINNVNELKGWSYSAAPLLKEVC